MEIVMTTLCIVQARMKSMRLPGKVMKPLGDTTVIGFLLRRLSRSAEIDKIILATSTEDEDTPLADHVEGLGYPVFRGSEQDVLGRYHDAAAMHHASTIVRITGDCPLIDPELIDRVISDFAAGGADYVSNVTPPTFPDGMDVEVFSMDALAAAQLHANAAEDREHVTPYIRRNEDFVHRNVVGQEDHSALRLTLDDDQDYSVISDVANYFHPESNFSLAHIIGYIEDAYSDNADLDNTASRNQGLNMGSGQKLWQRARKVIPAGNMLLSKRPEMFLPEKWPAYYSRTQGCTVWDLDNKPYTDMALMGVGTNLLGYNHPEVDDAVRDVINSGNMSSLNAPEEVILAEKLIDMHDFADMCRFCRTGGEANAVAIRIARAATGREVVAFCGYHGWHDWYLAANLTSGDQLNSHLLPGLEPNGVPESLRNSVRPFKYNRIDQLETLIKNYDLAAIKMEVIRNKEPKDNFLNKVRQLASDNGIVLIFDECTTGFRETFGGIHKKYGVEPDIAVFGKALGNGYAVTSVLGRADVMDAANTSFISSTFWTERIGSAAALKVLEVMEREKSWETVTEIGLRIRRNWVELADHHGLDISTSGVAAIGGFAFTSPDALKYKTLISQEMLEKGFLAGTSVYTSLAHDEDTIERYFDALNGVFGMIKSCEDGNNIDNMLKFPVCHTGFKRLN